MHQSAVLYEMLVFRFQKKQFQDSPFARTVNINRIVILNYPQCPLYPHL